MPARERDVFARVFEKAMQYRNQPQDTWPEKIESQTCNVRLMRMVEDFYDLEPAPSGEDQQADYLEEERESSLAIDHFAGDEPANSSRTITSRRICFTQDSEDDTSPFSPEWQAIFDEWNPPETEESTKPSPTRK